MSGETKESWHLSKSVNISVLLALVVYLVGAIWFFGNQNQKIEQNTIAIAKQEQRLNTLEVIANKQAVTLGRIDENIRQVRDTLRRIETNARTR